MKSLFLTTAVALCLASSCTDKSNTYSINGETSLSDGTIVYLKNESTILDSVTIQSGKFKFEGICDSIMFASLNAEKNRMFLFLEPGNISVNLDNGNAVGTNLNDEATVYEQNINNLQAQMEEGLNEDSLMNEYVSYSKEIALKHKNDALGLMLIKDISYYLSADELDSIMQSSNLFAKDTKLVRYYESKQKEAATGPGTQYIDIKGINAKNGEELSISDILKEGLPVVVDFWASWCGPCRQEITKYLSDYSKIYYGRCNFVGVAVWENSIEDTQKAMKELPITWPIIFAGTRENSPASEYGITGIPHIMLIAPDGTIVARNLRGEAIADAIDEIAD